MFSVLCYKNPGYIQIESFIQLSNDRDLIQKFSHKKTNSATTVISKGKEDSEQEKLSTSRMKIERHSEIKNENISMEIDLNESSNVITDDIQVDCKNNLKKMSTLEKIENIYAELKEAESQEKDNKSEILLRYCTICNIDQPIRTKHCYRCDRCVATYDHHSIFLDNCIGEKNRGLFYFYLLFQSSEAFILLPLSSLQLESPYLNFITFLFLINLTLTALLTYFLIFHSYLITKNLTTFENEN